MWTNTSRIQTVRTIIEGRRHRQTAATTTGSPFTEPMRAQTISKNKTAAPRKTSRTQVFRLSDPQSGIRLASQQRAAAMAGRRGLIELV